MKILLSSRIGDVNVLPHTISSRESTSPRNGPMGTLKKKINEKRMRWLTWGTRDFE